LALKWHRGSRQQESRVFSSKEKGKVNDGVRSNKDREGRRVRPGEMEQGQAVERRMKVMSGQDKVRSRSRSSRPRSLQEVGPAGHAFSLARCVSCRVR
jgi:hypothetical protein